MLMKALLLVAFAFVSFGAVAELPEQPPEEVRTVLRDPTKLGSSKFSYLFWDVYEADLWLEGNSNTFSWDSRFALALQYQRDIRKDSILNATISEIERIKDVDDETLNALSRDLAKCFLDIKKNDRIVGAALDSNTVALFHNGQEVCKIQEDGITEKFFSIWLSAESRDRAGAERLTGRFPAN